MSLTVFLVVIGAAFLHAFWNAAVKGSDDKLLGMTAIVFGHMIPASIALFFVELPSAESLPYMIGGIICHFGYQVFLLSAYKIGDFTQVYPIARGTGPLVVTVVSVLFLGVTLSSYELVAVGLIVTGIMSLSIVRQGDGLRNPKAAIMALTTGCFIAGYSLIDGLGARVSGSAVGFMSVLMLLNGVVFFIYLLFKDKRMVMRVPREAKLVALGGGISSYVAYVLVVWAFTQAPIPLVTALRETSIIFAVLIGVFIFRERLNLAKVISVMLSLAGAGLLRFGKFLS